MKKLNILLLLFIAGCSTGHDSSSERLKTRAGASAKVHTELAGMYYEGAQMGIALGEIELALQADPNYAQAYGMRGLIHMTLREYKEADEDFQQSLRIDKNDSETHNNYGWFLCQQSREKESISHFMAALKNPLYRTPEIAYLNAGLCSKKAGNNKDAEEFLLRALQLKPSLPQALLAMAEISYINGDNAAAKKYFSKFSDNADSMTAEQLWLAVRIERKVGDKNAEANYTMQLHKRFPDSQESQLLLRGQ